MRVGPTATAICLLAAACGGPSGIEADEGVADLEVTSGDLREGGRVPVALTCDGADEAPALAWSPVPDDATEVLVVVDDPDASGGTFTHWTVWGLDPGGALPGARPPAAAVEGTNDFGDVGYGGPCPPPGDEPHHYRFRVLALRSPLELPAAATPDEVADAIDGDVVAQGVITAVYGR